MKKKNSMVTLVVLVAILVLGVGYAVVSGVNLTINGNVATKTEDLDVKFTAATPTTKTNGVTAAITGNLTATIDVEDLELGQTATATYTISNQETDVDATVTLKSAGVKTNTDYYDVSVTIPSSGSLPAEGTLVVTVNVSLKKTPVTTEQSSDEITIELEANPTNS